MILAIDYRTDIPAFYSDWILNRFQEGFLYTRNPAYPKKIHKIILDKEHIESIIWTSKNYHPILTRLSEITNNFPSLFHYTITGYGKDIEPGVPSVLSTIDTYQKLSIKYGSDRVIWRYDPVFYYKEITHDWHVDNFKYIASKLNGYCDTCIINFVSLYEKTKRHMPSIICPTTEQKKALLEDFLDIIDENGYSIKLQVCGNGLDCRGLPRIHQASCIDDEAVRVLGIYPKKSATKAPWGCNCLATTACGEYNTCLHKCQYCYASSDFKKCDENFGRHDPNSPLLIGWPNPDDKIMEMKPKIINTNQPTLF